MSNVVFMSGTDGQCSVSRFLLYCGTVCKLVLGVVCVKLCNVLFMEGTYKQCSFSRLVLYCVTVCVLVLDFLCYVQQCCFYGRNIQTVQCGIFSALLCDSVYIGIRF